MRFDLNLSPGDTVVEFDSVKEFDVTTSGDIVIYDRSDNTTTQKWFLKFGSARVKAQKFLIHNCIKIGFSVYLTEVR